MTKKPIRRLIPLVAAVASVTMVGCASSGGTASPAAGGTAAPAAAAPAQNGGTAESGSASGGQATAANGAAASVAPADLVCEVGDTDCENLLLGL